MSFGKIVKNVPWIGSAVEVFDGSTPQERLQRKIRRIMLLVGVAYGPITCVLATAGIELISTSLSDIDEAINNMEDSKANAAIAALTVAFGLT